MQNFGRFFATSDFDCQYLRNGLKISKSEREVFQIDSSCVLWNRSRERWSTNFRDLDVRLDPPKCTFWEYYMSALKGCCALNFLHALEIDQGYLAHTPIGTEVPPPKKLRASSIRRPIRALERWLTDEEVVEVNWDMRIDLCDPVLVLGLISNQIHATRVAISKPVQVMSASFLRIPGFACSSEFSSP